jgi:tetratricopeptide (TPR) repeat protein
VVYKFEQGRKPQSEQGIITSAYQAMFDKDFDKTIKDLKNIDNFSKSSQIDGYMALGQAYFGKKDYQKSEDNYQKAENLSADANQKSYFENLIGNCRRENKKNDEAISEYQLSVKTSPINIIAWLNLVNIFEIKGDVDGAKRAVNEALVANPGNSSLRDAKKQIDS